MRGVAKLRSGAAGASACAIAWILSGQTASAHVLSYPTSPTYSAAIDVYRFQQDPSQPASAPSDRALSRPRNVLSLPVVRNGQPLGEIDVAVERDGSATFDVVSLREVIEPELSQAGIVEFEDGTSGLAFVSAEQLATIGIRVRFAMSSLEVVLEGIEPSLRRVFDLDAPEAEFDYSTPTVDPADFSASLSLASNLEYSEGDFAQGFRNPDVLAFGTIRAGRFGIDYEGGLGERGDGGYGPYRRFVRGLYEIEEKNLRFTAGDLQAETLPILGAQLLGGVGVERRRRIFSPFDPVFELGGRRILVNSPSTIEIVSNGQTIRTIPVDEGVYDLQQLPLVSGANDVDIVVRDAAGRTSVTSFNYFYDPVELEVGDYEYGAYAGLVSDFDSLEPNYGGDIAVTGFYRRAFSPSLLVGGAIQASERSQAVAGELRWVPQIVPGVVESQVAVSRGSNGVGFAARAGYRWGRSTENGGQQISVLADFETAAFEPVSRPAFLNERRFSVTANYGQNLTRKTYISAGVNYFERGNSPSRLTGFAEILHQFTPRLRGVIGAEYGTNDGFSSRYGIRAGLTLLLGRTSRATAAYESRRDLYRATYSKGLENRVGAFGYDATVQSTEGRSVADASVRYRGNRFDARMIVAGAGNGFGNITDTRRAQLQLSTSFAYADGAFGIGRPITDGFAIVKPHPSIKGEAIVGNNLNDGEYQARSGWLGGAVVPNLVAYQSRELIYDIDARDTIYDTGDGTDRVRVPTGGGAKIVVGDFRNVTVLGTLFAGGEPVNLGSGRVTSPTDEDFPTGQFFTNYRGRFSLIGLAQGETYVVELNDGRRFTIEVPENAEGLLRVADQTVEEVEK